MRLASARSGSRCGGRLLDRERAVDGRDDAGELDQRAVAHELDQAPAVGRDAGIEDPAAVELQPLERAGLVGLHQAAVADDVGRKYRGQFALHLSPVGAAPEHPACACAQILTRGRSLPGGSPGGGHGDGGGSIRTIAGARGAAARVRGSFQAAAGRRKRLRFTFPSGASPGPLRSGRAPAGRCGGTARGTRASPVCRGSGPGWR